MIDLSPFKFATDWIPKILDKLLEIREQRQHDIDQIADVFGDPIQLAKHYVEPDCQQFNPADDDDDEISYLVREPIFRRLEAFLSGSRREGKHQLFILSDAGMGKTSVLMMLKLGHLTSFWPQGYDCLLYKLGPDTLSEVEKIFGRRNKVLLLDALDEDPLAWGRTKERVVEILQETYNFRRVIITCRTQFFAADEDPFNRRGQVEIGGFLCPVIFNSLFSGEQTESYLKRQFKERRNSRELISQSELITQRMGSLKFRPMLLAHIEDFLEANQINWNEYTIYRTLVKVWLLREQRKRLDRREPRPSLDELWFACRMLALHLQKNGRHEMPENEIMTLMRSIPSLSYIPTLDITGRSLLNRNSKGHYRFSHYTIQEFLIVDGSLHGSINIADEGIKPTSQMNSFLAAWLADPGREGREKHLPLDIKFYDLSGCNLVGANLDGKDIRGLTLRGADLRNASFSGTQLQWSKLGEADLRGSNLRKAVLHWADFGGAKYDKDTSWPIMGPPEGVVLVQE